MKDCRWIRCSNNSGPWSGCSQPLFQTTMLQGPNLRDDELRVDEPPK